ncbi:MAG: hypothetical protein DWI29_03915 [Planctomycetota bacterium]|nr:MAG: hypothetical protein DWI29_03915 [Planctomycetota bacterium]
MCSSLRGVKHGGATSRQTSHPSSKNLGNRLCNLHRECTGFVIVKTASGLRFDDNFSQLRSMPFINLQDYLRSCEHAGKYS